jgi:hypothetical protein
MLYKLLAALLSAIFGAVNKGIEDKRDAQAKTDLGAAVQSQAVTEKTVETQTKMATAVKKARKSNVKKTLRDGDF